MGFDSSMIISFTALGVSIFALYMHNTNSKSALASSLANLKAKECNEALSLKSFDEDLLNSLKHKKTDALIYNAICAFKHIIDHEIRVPKWRRQSVINTFYLQLYPSVRLKVFEAIPDDEHPNLKKLWEEAHKFLLVSSKKYDYFGLPIKEG